MSYRSKRTRAEMEINTTLSGDGKAAESAAVEENQEKKSSVRPLNLTSSSLVKPQKPAASPSIKWGPFCPPSTRASQSVTDEIPFPNTQNVMKLPLKGHQKTSEKPSHLKHSIPQSSTTKERQLESQVMPTPSTVTKSPIWKTFASTYLKSSFVGSEDVAADESVQGPTSTTKSTSVWKTAPSGSSQVKPLLMRSKDLPSDKVVQAPDPNFPVQKVTARTSSCPKPSSPIFPSAASTKHEKKSTSSTKEPPVKPTEGVVNLENNNQINSSSTKPSRRRRNLLPDWPDHVEFNENEKVLTIDAAGNYELVRGSIQPHDVWHVNGVKYFVIFNEFYQPLKKGGSVLVRFFGDVAKTERFCPIGETNWHHVNKQYKDDIIKLIKAHFVIPDGEKYEDGALKRTGKSWRQYRHSLKIKYFQPGKKSKEEIYNTVPPGHARDSWMILVYYWYSPKSQELTNFGKEARASQTHFHITGATSYANIRADFEDEKNREPSELELFKETHQRKDGSSVGGTLSGDFVDDVVAKVDMNMLCDSSKSKSRVELENEAFTKLMYGDEIPKRPVGYGFGVKQSDIFGVRGLLRKEGFRHAEGKSMDVEKMKVLVSDLSEQNKGLVKQNEELKTKVEENCQLLKVMTTQFAQVLDAVSTKNTSGELLDLAK